MKLVEPYSGIDFRRRVSGSAGVLPAREEAMPDAAGMCWTRGGSDRRTARRALTEPGTHALDEQDIKDSLMNEVKGVNA
jgi:hypothetical protein